jgi:hypothetical protein
LNERIVGFYGQSNWGEHYDSVAEFGIVTIPNNQQLPLSLYEPGALQRVLWS